MTVRRSESANNADRIVHEHRQLAGMLRELAEADDAPTIARLAVGLHAMLAGHFVREEADDGLREAVLRASPHLIDQLEDIIAEHPALLDAVRGLAEAAAAGSQGQARLSATVADLIGQLRDHEGRESGLLSAALWDDVGGEG